MGSAKSGAEKSKEVSVRRAYATFFPRLTWCCSNLGWSHNDGEGIQGTSIFRHRGLHRIAELMIHGHIVDGVQAEGRRRVPERRSLILYGTLFVSCSCIEFKLDIRDRTTTDVSASTSVNLQ